MRKKATRRRRHRAVSGSAKPSLLGSLLLELVAIAGFITLMTSASANRNALVESQAKSDIETTANYQSMIRGYFSDQIQRHGFSR